MAPWSTQAASTRKCSEFLDSGEWAIQDSNLGTSSSSGKTFVAASRPNSPLIAANGSNGAGGRELRGLAGYKLVSPSWPHGGGSRARRRVARKRTSCRRYGHTRTPRRAGRRAPARSPRPRQASARGRARNHVPVGVQGQAGTVAKLPRTSAQRPPCRLDGVACLSPATPAGLRRNWRRR